MPNPSNAIKNISLLLGYFAFIALSLSVKAVEPIKLHTYTNYPPYLYHEHDQQTGLYMQIVDLTLKAINQPYTVQTLPFKRGLHQTANGDGVMIGIVKNEQRMQTLDFSQPFYQERVSVFFNHSKTPLIEEMHELEGLRIGTLLGWSYGPEFDKAKESGLLFTNDSNLEVNLNLLAKGRLDAMVHSELSTAYMTNKLGLNDKVFLASKPLALADIHFAVKKGTHKNLLTSINAKLKDPKHINKLSLLIQSYHSKFKK